MENQEPNETQEEPIDINTVPQESTSSALQQIPKELIGFIEDENGANKFLEAAGKFRASLPKMTKPEDWVSFGEPSTPEKCAVYLQEQSLLTMTNYLQAIFGYNVTIMPPKTSFFNYSKKDSNGKEYDVIETIMDGGIEIEDLRTGKTRKITPITGSSTTDDPWFSKKHGQILDPNQISRASLLKKAQANYRGNCFRLFWGLKGLTLADLKAAGLNIANVHDSKRRTAGDDLKPEEKTTLDIMWNRILRAHNNMPDKAREWLKEATAYPAYINKTTKKEVPAGPGFTDITRVRPGYGMKVLEDKIKLLEKQMEEAVQAGEKATKATASNAEKYSIQKYHSAIQSCKSQDDVLNLQKVIARDGSISKEQAEELDRAVSAKFDEFLK